VSGIVGIVNFDGAPVDRVLLSRMTNFMKFRGPDEQRIWVNGNIGFGHTLLRTSFESEHEHQPFTLDGRVWIVADARVDAQADLISKLTAHGEHVEQGAADVELILRAYRAWGEACVEHLLGDFAFGVWDSPRQRLFCARDHLGVKPFFYAHIGQTLIFSNTLDCIRQNPAVSDTLNDLAIADFLLFNVKEDPQTTSFVDISRIPPAHRATWSGNEIHLSPYWTLPVDEPVFFRRAADYTERFRELLDVAVCDRVRTNRVAIFMSGGLDSTTLAASASKMLRGRSTEPGVHAFTTIVNDADHNERYYAGLVADSLRIPVDFRDRSADTVDPRWNETTVHTPEPVVDPTDLVSDRKQYGLIATYSRVLFYGEGPDNALQYEWKPYLSYMARKGRFARLLSDVCGHIVRHRRIPLLPTVPRMLKNQAQRDLYRERYPEWLNENFEARLQLRSRWKEKQTSSPLGCHPVRPGAYESFHIPHWEALFRNLDADGTGAPIETRHPFVDLRLLRYMLAVPAIPWCRAKHLQRRAMRHELPRPVLSRPKSPLADNPAYEKARLSLALNVRYAATLDEYVNIDRLPKRTDGNRVLCALNFRPLALNYWLQNLRRERREFLQEDLSHECYA
jgi:asparagine synthase (glutamine-hydrolysing)